MSYKLGGTVVIGLGGSVVYPNEIDPVRNSPPKGPSGALRASVISNGIDVSFLKELRSLIKNQVKKGRKFVIVVGGGRISRVYQEAAGRIVKVTDEDKDWIGIHATRTNAQLLRTIFRELADPVVFDARHKISKLKYPVTIASGWRPGWSTDYVAVQIAVDFKISEVLVWGKPSHVFNKDPSKFRDAKPFSEISWKEYRKLIPEKWSPGAHAPVDTIAAKLADKESKKCIVIGKSLKNCKNLLGGREFKGTVIGGVA